MKRLFSVLILMIGVLIEGCVKKEPLPLPRAPEVGTEKAITKPGTVAFRGGERLTFLVKFWFIPTGQVSMEVREMRYRGYEVYSPLVKFKANRFFSFFCPAEGEIKSYLDARGLYTHRFEEHSVMGRHIYDRYTIYDQKKHLAQFTLPNYDREGRLVNIEKKKVRIPAHVQDILSTLYYIRTREFKEGKTLEIEVNERRNNYLVKIKVLEKEKIETPIGPLLTWRVEPTEIYKKGNLQEEKRGTIWFTADSRKVPVKIVAGTRVGRANCYLVDIRL